jgi:hypothetical protein
MIADRKILLETGGFDESLYVAEDLKLIYLLALSHGYSVVRKTLVTITRKRLILGLSDSAQPVHAFRRAESCLRLYSEILWQLVPLDVSAARISRQRMLYYASRAAEISSALGDKQRAQCYASFGLAADSDWKSFVRCLGTLVAYPLVRRHFARKWSVLQRRDDPYIV